MIRDLHRPIPSCVADADIADVLEHLNGGFARTSAAIRCPRHGVQPKVAFMASRAEGVYTEALVCCEELDDLVAAYVRRHLIEHPIGGWRFGGV